MKRLLVSTLCIFISSSPFPVRAYIYPSFTQVPNAIAEISASGRYLVGFEFITTHEELAAEYERTNQLPDFTYRISLWENTEGNVEQISDVTLETPLLTDIVSIFGLAFSPDETAIAIREDEAIRILGVPSLETETTIPIPVGQSLLIQSVAWSADSRYLAFTDDSQALAVWDRQSNSVVHSTAEVPFDGRITSTSTGWIIQFALFSPTDEPRLFQTCDLLLTECRVYSLNEHFVYTSVRVAPDGQGVLVTAEDGALWWWQHEQGNEYLIPTAPLIELEGVSSEYPPFFSPDGQYLAVPRIQPDGAPALDVYEVETGMVVASNYPAVTAAFVPETNALVWWDYRENHLLAVCLGQTEGEQISASAEETVIQARFQFAANDDYLLIENENVESFFDLWFAFPKIDCE